MVEQATSAAGLACESFINDLDVTPWIGTHIVEQARTEPIMRPCGHGTRCLAADATSTVAFAYHAMCVELGKKHYAIALATAT